MTACGQKVNSHALQLLASLNLQRQQTQFCDCVVVQRPNTGRVFPAHRCVLSASSPVLASILSSSGALVELHDQNLSDSVLAVLLDYIYTGSMQCSLSHKLYYNLLAAATHLQMDKLQETLKAWHQTRVDATDKRDGFSGAENQPYIDIKDADGTNVNSFSKDLPMQKGGQTCAADMDTCNDIYSCGCRERTSKNCCSQNSTSRNASICHASGRSTQTCTETAYLTPRDLIESFPCTAETNVFMELAKDGSHSATPELSLGLTEEKLEKVADRGSSTWTPKLQEEETSGEENNIVCLSVRSNVEGGQINREEKSQIDITPLPCLSTSPLKDNVSHSLWASSPYSSPPRPCSEAVSVICHSSAASMPQLMEKSTMPLIPKASVSSCSGSGSTDNDSTDTFSHNSFDKAQNLDISYKSDSSTDHPTRQNSEQSGDALSHTGDQNDHSAHGESFQEQLNDLRDDLMPQKRLCRNPFRRSKYRTDAWSDDCPSKCQCLECSDSHCFSMGKTGQSIHSHYQKVHDTDAGCNCQAKYLCSEGDVKEENTYSRRLTTNVVRKGSDFKVTTAPELGFGSINIIENPSASECSTSLEPHQISSQTPVDNTSVATSSTVMQSYHGHLQYHCLLQDTQIPNKEFDSLHSSPSCVDQSIEDEEVASPEHRMPTHHFARERVLLLDISTKPAELLFSYKQRTEGGESWVECKHRDTSADGLENNIGEQWDETLPVTGVDERKSIARKDLGVKTKSSIREANVAEKQFNGGSPGSEVLHKARNVETGSHTSASTVCSPPTDPESVQGSMSSTLSDSMPSTISGIMPTNKSSQLSTPVRHLYQCYLCDRSFSQRGSLNRHVRSHLGVRPFPCPRCPMTFSRQYRVTEHMRVHQRCAIRTDFQKSPASPT